MSIDQLSIDVRNETGSVVVALGGEIDYSNVGRIRAVLLDVVRAADVTVVVDMAEVEFVDSTVLGVLVQAKNRAEGSGGSLVVRNLRERVLRTFELAGARHFLQG